MNVFTIVRTERYVGIRQRAIVNCQNIKLAAEAFGVSRDFADKMRERLPIIEDGCYKCELHYR